MKLSELDEAKVKTQTKTDIPVDDLLNKPFHSPSTTKPAAEPELEPKDAPSKPEVKHKTHSAQATRQAASQTQMPTDPESMRHYMSLAGNLDKIDVSNEPDIDIDTDNPTDDTEGFNDPVEVTSTTLPAVIVTAMRADYGDVEAEWHMVKNLPGYMIKPIRALGRQIFSVFTHTPIDEIQVMATPLGQHTELNQLAGYLRSNGYRDREAEIILDELIPDYSAGVVIFQAEGITFMLVKDHMGDYVYSWPEEPLPELEDVKKNKEHNSIGGPNRGRIGYN